MPKIPDRVKTQVQKPWMFVKYTTGKNPKNPGTYVCRVPSSYLPFPDCEDVILMWCYGQWRYPGSGVEVYEKRVVGWIGPLDRLGDNRPEPKTEPMWGIKNVLKGSYGWKSGPFRTVAECKEIYGEDGDVICLMSMNGAYSEYEWIDSPSGGKWCDIIPF